MRYPDIPNDSNIELFYELRRGGGWERRKEREQESAKTRKRERAHAREVEGGDAD